MNRTALFILMMVVLRLANAQADSICYNPDEPAVFPKGITTMYTIIGQKAEQLGLFKTNIQAQTLKYYLVIDTNGRVVALLNGGCVVDTMIERIFTTACKSLPPFVPARKNGVPVKGARLFPFFLENFVGYGAEFGVKVSLEQGKEVAGKDFGVFIARFVKLLKAKLFYPRNYRPLKYDGKVQVEFYFNKKGKPTRFQVLKSDKSEFVENSLITLFLQDPISTDYREMIGEEVSFIATFTYTAYDDLESVFPSDR